MVGDELRPLLLSLLPSPKSQVPRRDLGCPEGEAPRLFCFSLPQNLTTSGESFPKGNRSPLGRRNGRLTARTLTQASCTCLSLLRLSESFYLLCFSSEKGSSLLLPSKRTQRGPLSKTTAFPKTAIKKYHTRGGLKHGGLLPHSSRRVGAQNQGPCSFANLAFLASSASSTPVVSWQWPRHSCVSSCLPVARDLSVSPSCLRR